MIQQLERQLEIMEGQMEMVMKLAAGAAESETILVAESEVTSPGETETISAAKPDVVLGDDQVVTPELSLVAAPVTVTRNLNELDHTRMEVTQYTVQQR